ncbi:hypothetical protein SynRS9907_00965 [Synechococcus sp. RS9907]|uniref:hypothetical protein n=1 Tax=Synechococcus sp. RS9907 TaxID=221350 RepID=UPI00165D9E50|nr:hypothetical protein [Synechococcus sp. RS9907]QNI81813.1 hypothetical protein SynRS9907_00965 [Synechococcus sp. RS9907]
MGWSAPAWVGLSDEKYSELIQRKAVAVTRRDKRRDGKYSVKEAIEAIHQAFHRCNGFDPYDGSKLDPELLGEYKNDEAKAQRAAYKRRFAMLPTVDHVAAEPVPDFEIVSWQTNDAKGDMSPDEFIAYCHRVVEIAKQH